jgi:hypothetical protein
MRFWHLPTLAAAAALMTGCSDLGVPVRIEPRIEASATVLDFDTVAVGDSATRSFTVWNAGNAAFAGGPLLDCPPFRLVGGGGTLALAPGKSRDLVLRFRPGTEGTFTCVLDLGAGLPQVSLTGTAAFQNPGAECTLEPGRVDFGRVRVGQSVERVFLIRSTGTAPLMVDVSSSCRDILPLTGRGRSQIPPGDSLAVRLLFNPLASGGTSCNVGIGPGCPEVAVAGFGTTVSYSKDVQRIFNRYCLNCHDSYRPSGRLSLDADGSYANLVDVRAYAYSGALRVSPFDPDHSVLFAKMNGTSFGAVMPPGGLLPEDLRNQVRAWILEGAVND